MNSFIDTASNIAYAFAALNIAAAIYYHYRYSVGPSSTKNFRNAQFHWITSAIFVIVAAATDRSLSSTTTAIIVIIGVLAPIVPVLYLRKIRTDRTPTIFDQIATDDIIDRARNGHTPD